MIALHRTLWRVVLECHMWRLALTLEQGSEAAGVDMYAVPVCREGNCSG